jgi:hypothetical protein
MLELEITDSLRLSDTIGHLLSVQVLDALATSTLDILTYTLRCKVGGGDVEIQPISNQGINEALNILQKFGTFNTRMLVAAADEITRVTEKYSNSPEAFEKVCLALDERKTA